jgi:hypothetical protein
MGAIAWLHNDPCQARRINPQQAEQSLGMFDGMPSAVVAGMIAA